MKKLFSTLTLLTFLAIPMQGAFAWSYEGINSLNPFTGFRQCNKCVKTTPNYNCKCKKQRLTKCEKLHGVKYVKVQGQECGCAAPIIMPEPCNKCHRAF